MDTLVFTNTTPTSILIESLEKTDKQELSAAVIYNGFKQQNDRSLTLTFSFFLCLSN